MNTQIESKKLFDQGKISLDEMIKISPRMVIQMEIPGGMNWIKNTMKKLRNIAY
tara:strand:- start:156 stop:317 length:162 start_codon:yes stop_codon:yes gene_type:complete